MLVKENTPEIETTHLRLRKIKEEDAQALFHIYKSESIKRYRPWLPFPNEKKAKEYIQKGMLKAYEKEIAYQYAIELKETQTVIGMMSIIGIVESLCHGEIEYAIAKEYWHQGYVKESLEALLEKAKENGFYRISAAQNTDMPHCGELMELVGMKYRYSFVLRKPEKVVLTYQYYQIDF